MLWYSKVKKQNLWNNSTIYYSQGTETNHIFCMEAKSGIHFSVYMKTKTIIERVAKKNVVMCFEFFLYIAVVRPVSEET